MPRFVILEHDHPFLHWDLLFERGEGLKTWRLHDPPEESGTEKGETIAAEALPDHRPVYLDYEGPVSGNRGTVKRWTAGEYTLRRETDDCWEADVQSPKLRGRIRLQREQTTGRWQFRRLKKTA